MRSVDTETLTYLIKDLQLPTKDDSSHNRPFDALLKRRESARRCLLEGGVEADPTFLGSYLDLIQTMIDLGADTGADRVGYRITPLSTAIEDGDLALVKVLHKAGFSLPSGYKNLAQLALRSKSTDVLKWVLTLENTDLSEVSLVEAVDGGPNVVSVLFK